MNFTQEKRRSKGPRCGVENCRSRYYDEGDDGYLYCENGHRKGELVTGQDEDDFSAARRTTTRTEKDVEEKQYKYFKGRQALDLYLKSLQLILRHQVWFLIHKKGLPAELETVVLDLWSLRILQLEGQIINIHESDSQSQLFSSQGQDSETEDEAPAHSSREKKLKSTPTLLDTLGLCYLGIITLRLPITSGDIHAWVMDGTMPYIRAIKYLPAVMREKLPASYHAVLDPNTLLRHERLYTTVIDLSISLEKEYGIIWPSLNYTLLLFRYLKELALPLELYDATIRLAGYLGYHFTLPREGQGKLGIRRLPEAQLAACLIYCVKLFYPFDGPQPFPKTTSEPVAIAIDWKHWYSAFSHSARDQQNSAKEYNFEELINLQEKDVFSMSGDQLDQYLDWYQDTILDEQRFGSEANDNYRDALYSMFPIDRDRPVIEVSQPPRHQQRLEVVKAVHSNFKPREVSGDEYGEPDTVRPGQRYRCYRKVEELPKYAELFYKEVAKIAGLSMDMLVLAVLLAEKAIEMWKREEKRRKEANTLNIVIR